MGVIETDHILGLLWAKHNRPTAIPIDVPLNKPHIDGIQREIDLITHRP